MLSRNQNLHVAFIDALPPAPDGRGGGSASVMVRGLKQRAGPGAGANHDTLPSSSVGGTSGARLVEEVYRVRLPHNPYTGRAVVVGEGKPENQNHAMIFAFGESLQAVDMNQDGCLAEAFKMRNLLNVSH